MTADELASVTLEHLRAIRADLVEVNKSPTTACKSACWASKSARQLDLPDNPH